MPDSDITVIEFIDKIKSGLDKFKDFCLEDDEDLTEGSLLPEDMWYDMYTDFASLHGVSGDF